MGDLRKLWILPGAFVFILLINAFSQAGTPTGVETSQTAASPVFTADWLTADQAKDLECQEFYSCSQLYVTSRVDCPAIQLDYQILDKSEKPIITKAVTYWGEIKADNKTYVEVGINNKISGTIKLSFPTFKCLDKDITFYSNAAMYDLPANLCDVGSYCSASSLNGRQIDAGYSDSGYVDNGFTGDQGSGYSVVCEDGWVSPSGGKQGACSHHGGVAD